MQRRRLHRYKYGVEDRTLALLYGYCRRHPGDRVIYIHSKGKGNLSFSFGNAFMMPLARVRIQLATSFPMVVGRKNRILSQQIRERHLDPCLMLSLIHLKSFHQNRLAFFAVWILSQHIRERRLCSMPSLIHHA